MAPLQKLTKKYYHFPLVSAQFRELEDAQDILKNIKKMNPRITLSYIFFKIDFSKKIEKKFQKKIFFSKTKSFHKTILRGLNTLTITHLSAKNEPNRGPTVRTLLIGLNLIVPGCFNYRGDYNFSRVASIRPHSRDFFSLRPVRHTT